MFSAGDFVKLRSDNLLSSGMSPYIGTYANTKYEVVNGFRFGKSILAIRKPDATTFEEQMVISLVHDWDLEPWDDGK